jgi:hypothetical protein
MAVVNSAVTSYYFPVSGGPSSVVADSFNSNNGGTGSWSAALVNTKNVSQSYQLTFPSTGNLPSTAETVNYTKGITDNNEDSDSVTIGALSGGITTSGRSVNLTLCPLCVVALEPAGQRQLQQTPRQ